jgi:hypothetical protein
LSRRELGVGGAKGVPLRGGRFYPSPITDDPTITDAAAVIVVPIGVIIVRKIIVVEIGIVAIEIRINAVVINCRESTVAPSAIAICSASTIVVILLLGMMMRHHRVRPIPRHPIIPRKRWGITIVRRVPRESSLYRTRAHAERIPAIVLHIVRIGSVGEEGIVHAIVIIVIVTTADGPVTSPMSTLTRI